MCNDFKHKRKLKEVKFMINNIAKISSSKTTHFNIFLKIFMGLTSKNFVFCHEKKVFVKSLVYLACMCLGVMAASSASAQTFAGPLTKAGVVTACRESGSDFGNLMKVALDIPSHTLSCDFQRASTAAKISRACQVTYGGNAFYNIIVSYDNRNAASIPTGRQKGCWY
jgi:hypothetical protein